MRNLKNVFTRLEEKLGVLEEMIVTFDLGEAETEKEKDETLKRLKEEYVQETGKTIKICLILNTFGLPGKGKGRIVSAFPYNNKKGRNA